MADFNLKNSRKIVKVKRPSLIPVFSNLSREFSASPSRLTHQFNIPPNDWYENFVADNTDWDAIRIPTADFDNPTDQALNSLNYDITVGAATCGSFTQGDDGGGGTTRTYQITCGGTIADRGIKGELNAISHPNFNNIPETKAISARASVSMGAKFVQENTGHYTGITVKSGDYTPGANPGGYGISLHGNYGGFYGPFYATIVVNLGLTQFEYQPAGAFLNYADPSKPGVAVALRIDVFPVRNGLDIDRDYIQAYWSLTGDDDDWNLLGSHWAYSYENTTGEWVAYGGTAARLGYYVYDWDTNNFGGGSFVESTIGGMDFRLATPVYPV